MNTFRDEIDSSMLDTGRRTIGWNIFSWWGPNEILSRHSFLTSKRALIKSCKENLFRSTSRAAGDYTPRTKDAPCSRGPILGSPFTETKGVAVLSFLIAPVLHEPLVGEVQRRAHRVVAPDGPPAESRVVSRNLCLLMLKTIGRITVLKPRTMT